MRSRPCVSQSSAAEVTVEEEEPSSYLDVLNSDDDDEDDAVTRRERCLRLNTAYQSILLDSIGEIDALIEDNEQKQVMLFR